MKKKIGLAMAALLMAQVVPMGTMAAETEAAQTTETEAGQAEMSLGEKLCYSWQVMEATVDGEKLDNVAKEAISFLGIDQGGVLVGTDPNGVGTFKLTEDQLLVEEFEGPVENYTISISDYVPDESITDEEMRAYYAKQTNDLLTLVGTEEDNSDPLAPREQQVEVKLRKDPWMFSRIIGDQLPWTVWQLSNGTQMEFDGEMHVTLKKDGSVVDQSQSGASVTASENGMEMRLIWAGSGTEVHYVIDMVTDDQIIMHPVDREDAVVEMTFVDREEVETETEVE